MSRMKSEDAIGATGRPFTGAEYLASLRDGREVYIYGERVDDVTTHPAFRNTARSVARLYDALHDGKSLSAIDGAKNASLLIRAVRMAGNCDQNAVRIARIDCYLRNLLAVTETQMRPGLSRIG